MVSRLAKFWDFARQVTIPSRDEGAVKFQPYGAQRYLVESLFTALADDRRQIVILKPRQIGCTTVLSIFDLFWMLAHAGLTGQFTADSDSNKEFFRRSCAELYESLMPTPRYHHGALARNNRNGLAWRNGSQLLFQTASNSKVGRGRGLVFMHGTEAPLWESEEAVAALRAAFSERHPARCFVFEGTANAIDPFNWFHDLWQEAEHAVSMAAIFIAWWRHELYQVAPSSKIFHVYWDGRLTADERAWQREITRRWAVEVQPEQWAWYRWKQAEVVGDERLMQIDFPTLPSLAFSATGSRFVGHVAMDRLRSGVATAPRPIGYRYEFGKTVEELSLHPVDSAKTAELRVWEEPNKQGYYIVACDPAFGTGRDRSIVSVWRARRQTLTQVAEFCSDTIPTQQLTWVLLHLAGSYLPRCWRILEVNGPGLTVLSEIQRLQQYGWGSSGTIGRLTDAIGGVRGYFFRRPDHVSTASGVREWYSTPRYRAGIFTRLKDCLLTPGRIVIRSQELVDEIEALRQEGDSFEAAGKSHDDRVVCVAMAIESWSSQVAPVLLYAPPEDEPVKPEDPGTVEHRMMQTFFKKLEAPAPTAGRR